MKLSVSDIASKLREGRILAAVAITFATLLLIMPQAFAAQPYNSGAYGECTYSLGCDPAINPPPTIVEVRPSPQNPKTGRAFSVNLHDGQQFKGSSYDVVVTPNFAVDQIKSVELYLNGKLVASSSSPQNSLFVLNWIIPKAGSYDLRVVINLEDGSVSARKFAVGVTSEKDLSPANVRPNSWLSDSNTGSWLHNLANSTPRPLAYAMPYIFFMLMAFLLLVLLYQTRNQLVHIKALLALLERDKQLADEKANFIMLSSHYVRTPLTILAGAIELAMSSSPNDPSLLSSKQLVEGLHRQAEDILSQIQSNKDLIDIKQPDIANIRAKLYRSWALILPILLSALLVVGSNWLFISAHRINLVIPSLLLQFVLFLVLALFLASMLQRRHQQHDESLRLGRQRDYEEVLDKTRNQFIKLSADNLAPKVSQVKASFEQSNVLKTSPQIISAIGQLESLINRFVLVTQLERGKIDSSLSKFDIRPTLQQTISEFEPSIDAKKLKLYKKLTGLQLHQAKGLLQYVTGTLLDNAVKFSPDNGRVLVASAARGRKGAIVTIRNQGPPIDPAILDRLFQPFSRSQSAEIANQSGAGLSLYLSRLIMRYLGGDVGLESDAIKTITAKLTFPRNTPRA